jgi:hypothetical protein
MIVLVFASHRNFSRENFLSQERIFRPNPMKAFFLLIFVGAIWAASCNPNYRVDCLWGTQSQCEGNGCCWDPYSGSPGGYPFCYHQWTQAQGYKLTSINSTTYGWQGVLELVQVRQNDYIFFNEHEYIGYKCLWTGYLSVTIGSLF